MGGRVCMVTGASSGIGRATAERLAMLGATVIFVCRDRAKGERTITRIRQKGATGAMELLLADFSSLESVRELARTYLESHDSLHVLINNAGIAKLTRSVTVDGLETTFQVDYLSQFLLTNLLLEVLKKSAPSRVVFVSSVAHYDGRIDFDDLQMAEGYSVMKAYSRAKLAQVIFSCELAERIKGTGVTVNSLHPGAVATNIWGRPLGRFSFLTKVTRLFLASAEEGAESPVFLASSPGLEGVTGKYFDRKREKEPAAASYDRALARRLWDTSAGLVGAV
ncbi:MAG: SDR family oxidoreductase [Nitrososphaerota archaeon]|nr:SDR family oxidoreductase [Nitrososphaerota archaeon]MDG6945310.1 SDR family oxidoreductase [Nitrososphaerota archaeon]MDG6949050.1 SDR family oxidoreductase [Nitrososphaerota archaeon]